MRLGTAESFYRKEHKEHRENSDAVSLRSPRSLWLSMILRDTGAKAMGECTNLEIRKAGKDGFVHAFLSSKFIPGQCLRGLSFDACLRLVPIPKGEVGIHRRDAKGMGTELEVSSFKLEVEAGKCGWAQRSHFTAKNTKNTERIQTPFLCVLRVLCGYQ